MNDAGHDVQMEATRDRSRETLERCKFRINLKGAVEPLINVNRIVEVHEYRWRLTGLLQVFRHFQWVLAMPSVQFSSHTVES